MSKLVSFLKKDMVNKDNNPTKINTTHNNYSNDVAVGNATLNDETELIGTLTSDEYSQIKESVVEIDMNDKTRREIIIGMFGGIKHPSTKKPFRIPGLDFSTEDYTYKYAEYMKMLVYRPNEFSKVMNWE